MDYSQQSINECLKRYLFITIDLQQTVDAIDHLLRLMEKFFPRRTTLICRRRFLRISLRSYSLPSRFTLDSVLVKKDACPLGEGASASVYLGLCGRNEVAVKRFHLNSQNFQAIQRKFIKEASILESLNHPSILPFTGVIYSVGELSIVSPMMKHGHVREYLLRMPFASKRKLVKQIAHGLDYLEHLSIVHGDLKGTNVLVDDAGNACIADFGLAAYYTGESTSTLRLHIPSPFFFSLSKHDNSNPSIDETLLFPTNSDAGTRRWMSPERLYPAGGESESAQATFSSDVFSFAMVIYEIYSGKIPFYKVNNMMAGIAITDGRRPERDFQIPHDLWELTKACWDNSPHQRPQIGRVIQLLSSGLRST